MSGNDVTSGRERHASSAIHAGRGGNRPAKAEQFRRVGHHQPPQCAFLAGQRHWRRRLYAPAVPKSTGEEWFGAPAAARYLGIYLTTLYRLINAGDLPAYQIGRVIRLRRSEVDAYIERSRVRPGELDHLLYGPDYDSLGRADIADA